MYLQWTSILNRESGFMLQKSCAAVLIQQFAIDIYFFVNYLDINYVYCWIMCTVHVFSRVTVEYQFSACRVSVNMLANMCVGRYGFSLIDTQPIHYQYFINSLPIPYLYSVNTRLVIGRYS